MAGIGIRRLSDDDPQRLGGYRLLWRLTTGGMGRIYLARSTSGGPLVAVKTLLAEGVVSRTDRERFAREVELARRIDSTYTARVLDADASAALPWMAIEYVPAPALSDLVRDAGALPGWAVPSIAAGTVQALLGLHEKGVIHRDVKPQNILLPLTGPLLIDFGISHAVDLTRTSLTLGTIAFTSPEQARGEPSTAASDMFSLGATLFHVAVGRVPYRDVEGPMPLLALVQGGTTDLTGLPGQLEPLIRPCLALKPEDRPEPARLLELALETRDRMTAGRRGGRWLPAEWTAVIEAYEAHGRGLDADRNAASDGRTRPMPPPPPTLIQDGERTARREREREAREARARRDEELRRLAEAAARERQERERREREEAAARAQARTATRQPAGGGSNSGGGGSNTRNSNSGGSSSSSAAGGWAVVAVLVAIALLTWQPWDSDETAGSSNGTNNTNSSSIGASSGSSSSGSDTAGSDSTATGSTGSTDGSSSGTSTSGSDPDSDGVGDDGDSGTDAEPTPDRTEEAFKNVSSGDCLSVYDTGRGNGKISWNASVPPDPVSCASERAHVQVSNVTSGSCPSEVDKARWSYVSDSGDRTSLCLTRIYHKGYCLLGENSGDSIQLSGMTLIDCKSGTVPAGFDRILHIAGVYQAPAGADSGDCGTPAPGQNQYRAYTVNNGNTLLCTRVFKN